MVRLYSPIILPLATTVPMFSPSLFSTSLSPQFSYISIDHKPQATCSQTPPLPFSWFLHKCTRNENRNRVSKSWKVLIHPSYLDFGNHLQEFITDKLFPNEKGAKKKEETFLWMVPWVNLCKRFKELYTESKEPGLVSFWTDSRDTSRSISSLSTPECLGCNISMNIVLPIHSGKKVSVDQCDDAMFAHFHTKLGAVWVSRSKF